MRLLLLTHAAALALLTGVDAALLPVILVDNGSKRAASSLTLRESAAALSTQLGGRSVHAASLAYSDSVPADALGGVRAQTLNQTLEVLAQSGASGAIIAPLFLGPSMGLRRAVDSCTAALDEIAPSSFDLRVGPCLVDEARPGDDRIARALASHVLRLARRQALQGPLRVVVCDHGTPSPAVHAVRERLATEVRAILGTRALSVIGASMERRDDPAYDFNEPLLERCLGAPPHDSGDVVVAMAFLMPGRHAGDGGDVAQIVDAAVQRVSAGGEPTPLRVHVTPPLATHSSIVSVLADRVRAADADAISATTGRTP